MLSLSIVSHAHGDMVCRLIEDSLAYPDVKQIIVTQNIPETLHLPISPKVLLIRNDAPKGFGANHNQAFKFCTEPFFCPINPDISLLQNPFPLLIDQLTTYNAGLVAPRVVSASGLPEDSWRYFPTFSSLAKKAMGQDDGTFSVPASTQSFHPDWVAGMFMLFDRKAFARLNGFDQKFFLYYEDVDICARAWSLGIKVLACPQVSVIHDAQRASRRNLRYMRWHFASMARYFWKHWGRLPQTFNKQ